jgi:hydroxypyruvate reductase
VTTRENTLAIYQAAIDAVHPKNILPHYLQANANSLRIGKKIWQKKEVERLIVIAIGKAAAAMAQVTEQLLGNTITYGICITKYHHALPLQHLIVHEAAHPLPDEASVQSAALITQMLEGCSAKDIVLVLLSGGASSLAADIPYGIALNDYKKLNELLINSGASINEINTVRREICTLKGGRFLQQASPAFVATLAISDVVNDDIAVIGSGLTVPSNTSPADAEKVLQQYALFESIPSSIKAYLRDRTRLLPNKNLHNISPSEYYVIANNGVALKAAQQKAFQLGYNAVIFQTQVTGNTELVAKRLVQQLRDFRGNRPACFILGGETTLKVDRPGKGGRCQHFALAAFNELLRFGNPEKDITIFAAGTDGTDGPTNAAGAIADKLTRENYTRSSLIINDYLIHYNSFEFFEKNHSLITVNPTQTNVCDLMMFIL